MHYTKRTRPGGSSQDSTHERPIEAVAPIKAFSLLTTVIQTMHELGAKFTLREIDPQAQENVWKRQR